MQASLVIQKEGVVPYQGKVVGEDHPQGVVEEVVVHHQVEEEVEGDHHRGREVGEEAVDHHQGKEVVEEGEGLPQDLVVEVEGVVGDHLEGAEVLVGQNHLKLKETV